jgi:hypothetical protein
LELSFGLDFGGGKAGDQGGLMLPGVIQFHL